MKKKTIYINSQTGKEFSKEELAALRKKTKASKAAKSKSLTVASGVPSRAVLAFTKKVSRSVSKTSEGVVGAMTMSSVGLMLHAVAQTPEKCPVIAYNEHENVSRITKLTPEETRQAGDLLMLKSVCYFLQLMLNDPKVIAQMIGEK